MSLDSKAEQFELEHRVLAVIEMLGQSLVKHDHQWTNEERKAYDWAVRSLNKDMEQLAA